MIRLRNSPETAAAFIALRRARASVRKDILGRARRNVRGDWRSALGARARSTLDNRVIVAGARVAVSQQQISLMAATRSRPLSGGLVPSSRGPGGWPGVEYGARTRVATFETRSPKGTRYRVTKRINVGLPNRQAHGRLADDAASEVGRRIVANIVVHIVDSFREFADEITPR